MRQLHLINDFSAATDTVAPSPSTNSYNPTPTSSPLHGIPPMTTSCLITQLIRVSSSSEREVDSLAVHPLIVEGQLNLFSYA